MTNFINHNDQVIQSIVDSIVRIANPDKIILFGSRAKGKAKKDSDYDICVLKKNIKKRRKLVQKIHLKLDIKELVAVDVVANTLSRFEALKDSSYYIYYDINKFGKVVYEKK